MPVKKRFEHQNSTKATQENSLSKETLILSDQKTTKTGSSDTTKPTTRSLEQEAQEFRKRKNPPLKPKPMSSRIYLAGQAMSALLARSQGMVRKEDIKKEAYEWADFMLE